MKLILRIGYYLGGFAIGLLILAFFFSGKKTSCAYSAEARVIKNINSKKIVFTKKVSEKILENNLDSIEVLSILKFGDIKFSKSNPRQEPCGIYYFEGKLSNQNAYLQLENCDSISRIIKLSLKN